MKTVNGTSYHDDTPEECIKALESARKLGFRIHLDYGCTKTGRSWNEQYEVAGYIGRSLGPQKVPLLIYNKRSIGGGAILDHCILSIRYANKKDGGFIYRRTHCE